MKEFKSEGELKIIAAQIAESITVRAYDERGNSNYSTRETTHEERETIFNICYGALLGFNWTDTARSSDAAAQAVLDATEFTVSIMLPYCNACSTVYEKLQSVIENWEDNKS